MTILAFLSVWTLGRNELGHAKRLHRATQRGASESVLDFWCF
jgi:hypothetical protein